MLHRNTMRRSTRIGARAGIGFATALFVRAVLLVGLPTLVTASLLSLPWPGLQAAMDGRPGARITDRNGALIGLLPGRDGSFQERLGPAEIPPACAALFVDLEDRWFYFHPGVDPLALVRVLRDLVGGGGVHSGASTIPMQLARLVSPHNRGVGGKLVEALNAVRLVSLLGRDRVLTAYLNEVPFGRNARGVGAAAWTYFGADLSTLSRAQLLALAVIPRNPTVYDPFQQPSALIDAARGADARLGLGIPPAEIDAAVHAVRSGRPAGGAPHFARYVAGLVADGTVTPVDGRVRTTLDLGLNAAIEARVRFVLDRYVDSRITNAAVVVVDTATGGVLGWVGSRDFQDDAHSGQIDGALIRRQSASTLKPFLYASAIQSGWTADTLLPDAPLEFGSADEESYRPLNFDRRSHGVVRLRTALASSLNVPAVFTLSKVGVPSFLSTLRTLGFSLPPDAVTRYGLGTAIGNAEVSLAELTHAFSVFPRGGTLVPMRVVPGSPVAGTSIFDPFSAWIVTNILSDPSARAVGFGTHTYFRTPFPSMFKTGTSSEFTNLWSVGATPRFTAGVWAGNFDGRAVINKTGSIVPTQILTDVLEKTDALQGGVPGSLRDFARPPGVVEARICTDTGEGAPRDATSAACASTRVEYFRSQREVPAPRTAAATASADQILQERFLDAAHPVRILFPVNGQVFYLDQTVSASSQRIPILLAARPGSPIALTIDGRRVAGGDAPSVSVALTRGAHSVTVSGFQASDTVTFDVR
jgi:penicillin-binding protein 1C